MLPTPGSCGCAIVSLIYMPWLHLRSYMVLSFKMLSSAFSFPWVSCILLFVKAVRPHVLHELWCSSQQRSWFCWCNMPCNFYHILTGQVSNMLGFIKTHCTITGSKWWGKMVPLLCLSEQQYRCLGGKEMKLLRKREWELTQKTAVGTWRFSPLKWRAFQTLFQVFFVPWFFCSIVTLTMGSVVRTWDILGH